jgi:hypothetical protein
MPSVHQVPPKRFARDERHRRPIACKIERDGARRANGERLIGS